MGTPRPWTVTHSPASLFQLSGSCHERSSADRAAARGAAPAGARRPLLRGGPAAGLRGARRGRRRGPGGRLRDARAASGLGLSLQPPRGPARGRWGENRPGGGGPWAHPRGHWGPLGSGGAPGGPGGAGRGPRRRDSRGGAPTDTRITSGTWGFFPRRLCWSRTTSASRGAATSPMGWVRSCPCAWARGSRCGPRRAMGASGT